MSKIKTTITTVTQLALLALAIALLGPTVESLTSQSLNAVVGAFILAPMFLIALIMPSITGLAQTIIYAIKRKWLFVLLQAIILAASILVFINFYSQVKA